MTQDNDDLLAQVFSALPPMEQHHEINGNNFKEDNKEEISASVRRVSNAFEDFLAKSGVVETQFQTVTESQSESHFQVMTTHVETHHEVVTSHHEEHHVEEHIGHGVAIESHVEIGGGVEFHEEEHHHTEIGNGVSLISGEQLPPVHETYISSIAIGHGAEAEVEHIGHGVAVAQEDHFTIGHGASPIVQDFPTGVDDRDSVVSARTGLSQATSVSVHSSVSQKSIPIYADAPVIVKAPSSHHSVVSHHSQSTVKDSHHSDVTHTHDKESTITLSSAHSKNTEATLTGSHQNTYVFVEKSDVIEAGSELSAPVAPLKSAPHDAVIEEFRQLHHRQPSEVSIPPAVPTSAPPPLDDEEENASDVVMTVRVTQYEFDSNHVKNSVAVEYQEHHEVHEHHHHDDVVEHYYHQYEESHQQNEEDHHAHEHHADHHDLHVEEHITHVAIGEGAQVHDEPAIGEGVQLKHIHHLESDDEFKFEEVEYHEHHEHVEEKAPSVVSSVVTKSEPPPVFFQSPVLSRRVPSHVNSHVESDSSDDETIHGSEHEVVHHHHHHHEEHHHEHEAQHHHDDHQHVTVHKDLIPNLSRPHVRDGLRSAHVHEEYRTTTVTKTASAPVAHVSPVVSQEKGHAKIDHHEKLTPMVETAPIVHTKEVVHEVHDHHAHHDDHHDHHEGEKHYHKHDEHVEEIFSGPSVRDLKSKFEHGGKVDIHYTTHYISHTGQTKSHLDDVQLQHVEHHEHKHEQAHEHAHEHSHNHEHDHHHHVHHEHAHEHHEHQQVHQHHEHELVHQHHEHLHHERHEEQKVNHVVVEAGVPHLPLRESPKHTHEEHHHHHHHHEDAHKHHHHRHHRDSHHKHHNHHHEKEHHKHHDHHDEHHHHHHEHIEHQQVQQQVEVVEQHHHHHHHEEAVEHHIHETHHEHVEHHVVIEKAVEEDQLPVSLLLSKFGGGAKLRRPDHVEEIKIYSRSSSDGAAPVVHQVEEPAVKSRTVTQSTVSTMPTRSQSTYSVQSTQRSHASTLTQSNVGEVHVHKPVAVIAVCPPAPVAAARSISADHNSVRVVKSVRAFVNQWGQKDFKPPSSPVISVPRLPSSPQGHAVEHPEPISRKSTIVSQVSSATGVSHKGHHVEKVDRSHSVACSEANSVAHSEARSVARSEATSVATSKTCDCCSICGASKSSKATSKASSKRPSVASQASTVTTTTYSVHKSPETFVETTQVTAVTQQHIPEVCEEFVLTPLADRRAMFEHGVNRGYSIRRNLHGELRPMVNVFTD